MKTKEEILAQKTDWVCEQPFSKLKQNILEAMQLYSDQQNKEKDAEIQRLTKEVEQLRLKVEKWVFSGVALHAKITRLRELLGRAKEYIPFVRINGEPERHTSDCKYPYSKCKCHLEELLTEIDNETDGKDN